MNASAVLYTWIRYPFNVLGLAQYGKDMLTKNVVVSDMPECNLTTVYRVGAVSPVTSSHKKSDVKYFKQILVTVIRQYEWYRLSQG